MVQTVAKPGAAPAVVQASNPPPAQSGPLAPRAAGDSRSESPTIAPVKDAKNTDQARALLAQARKAIDAGDLIKARQLIDQARR